MIDLFEELMKYKKEAEAAMVDPPKRHITLTLHQKKVIVNYVLSAFGKGLFEDCKEFWEGVDDIKESYSSYRDAVDEFVEDLKKKILRELQ